MKGFSKKKENYLMIILALLSMTFSVYIGTTLLKRFRVDLTEEKLYTLSQGTKSILSKVDSPIKLKLYYSKTAANKGSEGLRTFNNYFLYVEELLNQYVQNSRNNLSLEVIDPRPDTPEEEDAIVYGLKKFHLSETEKYFFGLVAINDSGTEKIIEFFDPNQKDKLEYELTKLVYKVQNPQKKTVGVLSSLDLMIEDVTPMMAQIMRMQGKQVSSSWNVINMLKEFFNIRKIDLEADSISNVDVLVVVHPQGFSEKLLFAIDQYLLKGGKLLVFTDPHSVSDNRENRNAGFSKSPDVGFKKLLDQWGINQLENNFVGDKRNSGVGRTNPNMPPQKMLAILNCGSECTELHNDSISTSLNRLNMVLPGALEFKNLENVTHTTILSTGKYGNTYSAMPYELNNHLRLWEKFNEGTQPVSLGIKAVGKFKSAFPDGLTLKGEKEKKDLEVQKESVKESAVIVFSDVDFLSDQFAFRNTFLGPAAANDNSTLFLNAVESLTGDVDLLSVRSKGKIDRSFDVITEIELESEKKTAKKVNEINANISRFQVELNELTQKSNGQNVALIKNEGLKKRKELTKKIAVLKKGLRSVKREGREKIEMIGKLFLYINTLFVPSLIIIVGLLYYKKRQRLVEGKRNSENQTEQEKLNIQGVEA